MKPRFARLFLTLACLLVPLSLWAAPKVPKMPVLSVGGIVMSDEAPAAGSPLPYRPVVGVNVTVEGDALHSCISDEKGFFHLEDLPKGACKLVFSKVGFTPTSKAVDVDNSGFSLNVRVIMNPLNAQASTTSAGTVYVAYADFKPQTIKNSTRSDLMGALIAGVDYDELSGRRLSAPDPHDIDNNNICNEPDHLMLYPPSSPSRTAFSKLDDSPYWLCFNRSGSRLYVSTKNHAVAVLDNKRDNELLLNLPFDGAVIDLTLSDDGRFVVVATMKPDCVTLIDTSTDLPEKTFATSSSPRTAELRKGRIYCCEGTDTTGVVEILDAHTGRALATTTVGPSPTGLAFTPDGSEFIVVNSLGASVSFVDTSTLKVLETVRVNAGPRKVAISPEGKVAVVTNRRSDTLSILDVPARRVRATVKMGREPIGVGIGADGTRAYVGCWKDGTVEVVDLVSCRRVHKSTPAPLSAPWGVAIHP